MSDDGADDMPRTRSPRHPSFDLAKAVEKAATLYKAERMNAVARSVAVGAWGYSEKSSPGRQALATMSQFGLLERVSDGTVRLSKLAQRILILEAPEQRAHRVGVLKEAARMPPMHRDVLDRFPTLPSDASLRYYLIHDRQFVDDSADDFIRQLKATLAYAEISDAATMPSEPESADAMPRPREDQPMTAAPPVPSVNPALSRHAETFQALATPPGRVSVQLAIARGKWATLTAPESMSSQEWANLEAALRAQRVGFVSEDAAPAVP